MPVRKIKKNFRSLTGAFYSLKNKKSIFFESKLERDLFLTLEFDKDVISYEEQPIRLQYKRSGKTYPYTPDCLVHYNNKPSCIIEVKYSDEIKEKKVFLKAKFDQIEDYLQNNDFDFKLFSELDIDSITLENMQFIYNYVTINNNKKVEEVHKLIMGFEHITYKELLCKLSNNNYKQAELAPYIWHLVLIGKIEIDITRPIANDTIMKVLK